MSFLALVPLIMKCLLLELLSVLLPMLVFRTKPMLVFKKPTLVPLMELLLLV
jgi:hypothetical protein